jgi:hypothetical protein
MALGRRPREVYRAFSEEQLLEDGSTMELFDDEPAAGAADGGAFPPVHTPRPRRARALGMTLLATLLGLAVGLGVVSLIGTGRHRGEVSSSEISDGRALGAGSAGAAVPGRRRALPTERRAGHRTHEGTARQGRREWSGALGRPRARSMATAATTGAQRPVAAAGGLAGGPIAVAVRAPSDAGPPGGPPGVPSGSVRQVEFGFER